MQWLVASTATRKQIIPVYLAAVGADLHRGQPGCLQARRSSEAPTRRLFNAGVPSEIADLSRRSGQAGQRQACCGSHMLVAPPGPLHVRPINGIISAPHGGMHLDWVIAMTQCDPAPGFR